MRLSIANQNSRPSAILRCASARAGAPSRQPVRGTPMKAGQGARTQGPKDTRYDHLARFRTRTRKLAYASASATRRFEVCLHSSLRLTIIRPGASRQQQSLNMSFCDPTRPGRRHQPRRLISAIDWSECWWFTTRCAMALPFTISPSDSFFRAILRSTVLCGRDRVNDDMRTGSSQNSAK